MRALALFECGAWARWAWNRPGSGDHRSDDRRERSQPQGSSLDALQRSRASGPPVSRSADEKRQAVGVAISLQQMPA